jgi:hypothetical protein
MLSSDSRSTVSGVRSWWEASATNTRWAATRVSRRSAAEFRASASVWVSGGPRDGGAGRQVAVAEPAGHGLQLAQRLGQEAYRQRTEPRCHREDPDGEQGPQLPDVQDPFAERADRIADPDGAVRRRRDGHDQPDVAPLGRGVSTAPRLEHRYAAGRITLVRRRRLGQSVERFRIAVRQQQRHRRGISLDGRLGVVPEVAADGNRDRQLEG